MHSIDLTNLPRDVFRTFFLYQGRFYLKEGQKYFHQGHSRQGGRVFLSYWAEIYYFEIHQSLIKSGHIPFFPTAENAYESSYQRSYYVNIFLYFFNIFCFHGIMIIDITSNLGRYSLLGIIKL